MSTCILSKRWKYVPKSIASLDFRRWRRICGTEEILLKTKQFMDFLDTVLYFHERPKIKKFCLTWNHFFDECRLSKWIGIVIERKIEELFLYEGANASFMFPASFYTCDSLTVLELDGVTLNVPNTVSFPRLKLLRLRSVSGISVEKLLSNCPILEELSLRFCSCFSSEVLCLNNLALENLDITSCSFQELALKISAPNLLSFGYDGELPKDFVSDSFPALVEADIDLYYAREYQVKTMIRLFEKLSNLKFLAMSGRSFMGIICNASWLDNDSWSVDPKCSLLHLKSVIFKNFNGKQFELDAIKFFLRYAGALETMTIEPSPLFSGNYEAENRAMRQLLMFHKPINCMIKFA